MQSQNTFKVLMISGDVGVIKNIDGPFSLTLRELSKHWSQIQVLCPGQLGRQRQFSNNVHLLGVHKFFLFFDLLKILKQQRFDLIVTHDYGLMLNGISAFFWAHFFKIPQISEIHHLEGFPISTSWKERFYSWWGKKYIHLMVRKMKAVRVDNMGDIVKLLKNLGVPDEKIVYLPPIYLDLDIYKPLETNKSRDLLFVGRLAQNKGIFTILKAVEQLQQEGTVLKTTIKGRGPLKQEILDYIRKNNLEDLVELDERILSEPQLTELYNQAKVLVCASTVEGGPRVTLEAMACDVPVITTPCGIMPEVIVDGENGYLFDGSTEDLIRKIKSVHTDNKLVNKNIRKNILKYDYKNTLSKYGETYLNLIQQRER